MKPSSPCSLHVVSLQVPYPPDYGGVIDIYYKLKALKEAGLSVWLHTYQYNRLCAVELENIVDRVSYYPRDCSVMRQLSLQPYIVNSRRHKQLIEDLLEDDSPILFEGLHCCNLLDDKRLSGRKRLVRAHNVEHDYYKGLAQHSWGIKSLYYRLEAYRLKRYESILSHADVILAITESDRRYFAQTYSLVSTQLLPAFHANQLPQFSARTGNYVLYQGNLSVEENIKAVEYLLHHVVPLTPAVSWVFAGKNPSVKIKQAIDKCQSAQLIANPSNEQMEELIKNARANVLVTFQPTGLKLKLLHALFLGGTCIVNTSMLEGTNLAPTCWVADTPHAIATAVKNSLQSDFTYQQYIERVEILKQYDNQLNARIIANIIA